MIGDIKKRFSLPYTTIARQMGISYASLMRWKRRVAEGRPAVRKPGPKKVEPLDLNALGKTIADLSHGTKRSCGTGHLYGAFKDAISRRDLDRMVGHVRREGNRRRALECSRVTWLRPNLAWAIDDCQKPVDSGSRLHLHNLTDLCSRYRLPPLGSGHEICGEQVAGHLDRLFIRFGPPLFCKRDNGGNLNHPAVDDVLADALVIPINSPVATASYNGGIENCQGEFKRYLERWKWKAGSVSQYVQLAETAAHDLNHRPRRSLRGKTACRVYFGWNRLRYAKRKRKEVYAWIRDLATEISEKAGKENIVPLSWRLAAKQWLIHNGLIRIRKPKKVLPHLSQILCHN